MCDSVGRRSDRLKSLSAIDYAVMDECGQIQATANDPDTNGVPNDVASVIGNTAVPSECADGKSLDESPEELQKLIHQQMARQAELRAEFQTMTLRQELAQLQAKNTELEQQMRSQMAAFHTQTNSRREQNAAKFPSRISTELPAQLSTALPFLSRNVPEPQQMPDSRTTARDVSREVEQCQGHSPKAHALKQVDQMISAHNRRDSQNVVSGRSARESSRGESSDESAYSFQSRDKKRGKRKTLVNRPCCSHVRQDVSAKQSSGLKDQLAHKIINRQRYPQAALQHEYLWDWAGLGV